MIENSDEEPASGKEQNLRNENGSKAKRYEEGMGETCDR
jgi:hypothetical protein